MADKKLEIGVEVVGADKASADLKKVEDQTKESIFSASDASEEAKRRADVEEVQARRAVEVQKEQAATLREIADAQQRIVAAQLAQTLGRITQEFRGIGPEAELALNGVSSFLNVLASTGNPIAASFAVVGTAIGGVVTAYKQAEEQVKNIEKAEAEQIKHIAELRQAYTAQVRAENLTSFFQQELDALDKQEAALKRIFAIRASERELATAQQAAAGAAAVAAGASAPGVAANNLEAATNNKVADLQDALAKAQAATTASVQTAEKLELEAKALINLQGEGGKDALDAAKKADEARAAAEKSKLDLAAFTEVTGNQIRTAIEQGKQAGIDISTAGLAALKESVAAERDALKAEVDRLGSKASINARTALATLEKILSDNAIDPSEIKGIQDAAERVRGSQELYNAAVKAGFDSTAKSLDAMLNQIKPALDRISAIETQLRSVRR